MVRQDGNVFRFNGHFIHRQRLNHDRTATIEYHVSGIVFDLYICVMADNNSEQEKTEEPTQRRLEKAREEGNISISNEISSAMLLVVALFTIIATGSFMYGRVQSMFTTFFQSLSMPVDNQESALAYLKIAAVHGFEIMLPLLIALIATALIVNLIQTKGAFSFKALEPKGSNMNPINGMKNIFSMKGLVELAKGFSKLVIMGYIVYYTISSNIDRFVAFAVTPIQNSISNSGYYILMYLGRIFVALFVLSIADAVYQKYQYKKDLKMTKKEVKDEHKETEGDPHIKGKRKEMGMTFRQKRLDHAVLESDVVVANPTHYAVALQYDPNKNNAPIVMAKGQRMRALKIKELAKEFDVPIVENKAVAQALYASAEVDQYIPEELYRAVAEILAYVYKLKKKHNI